MTEFAGRQLDSYRIDTLVGQSSAGAVYRALDLKQGRPVRLTVVDQALVPDPSIRQRFQQQIRLAIRLAHPAIVKVLDHGENEDRVYFVTEPETAHKLGAVLERISSRGHVIQLDETLYLMAQVADALVLAHRHGCIHGHLQPDNILLERLACEEDKSAQETVEGSLQARVTGFGLNSLVNTHWLDNQVEALPYLSPEQCMGQEAGDRSDIYALGAILYTLATGRPPLSVASAAEANRPTHDCGEKPPAPQEVHPGLPATVAAIIHKAMARQPGERFRTVDQMLYALRQARALLTETTQERFSPPDKTTSLVAHLLTTAMDDTAAEDVIQPIPRELLIARQGQAPRIINIDKPQVTIGRFHDNDVVLEEVGISRQHVRLEWTGNGWRVVDLGSTNGTRLAMDKLAPNEPRAWPANQALHVGPYSLHWLHGAPTSISSPGHPVAPVLSQPASSELAPAVVPSFGLLVQPATSLHSAPALSEAPESAPSASLGHTLSLRRKEGTGRQGDEETKRLSDYLTNRLSDNPRHLMSAGLLAIWLLVIAGIPAYLPVQPASWLTFIALLITPGYLLADLITWRTPLDGLERLALALPLGVAILAVPGMVALLHHLTLLALVTGWIAITTLVAAVWLIHVLRLRQAKSNRGDSWQSRSGSPASPMPVSTRIRPTNHSPWAMDEIAMLLLLLVAFIAVVPTLSLPKIDGDAYAVSAFAADALSGLPLNATEPLFGTDFGPGVRMVFNQSLPLSYLWSYLSKIDPITLTATASRSMLALWALLATYALGRAAGNGSRRFGLFTASIQMLIYLAAPFTRGDNVSLFFFERINADKFMVPVTMLPVVFALAIRYVGHKDVGHKDVGHNATHDRRDIWLAAAVATFAVSAIHPLVAAMLALGLGAFAGLHWLVNLRQLQALKRSLALGGLVAVAMFLPVVQLVAARGEAPLARSYPDSFDGWPIGEKLTPILPFIHVRTLDLYGPLPVLSQLEADIANTNASPFLIWRFAVNMGRQRLILFDHDQYIADPTLILEPPYLLALLLLPLLAWRLRRSVAAQFAVATTLAVFLVIFNPVVTPLIGSAVMPWILWRFVWLLPYALTIALATHWLLLLAQPALVAAMDRLPPLRLSWPGSNQEPSRAMLKLGFVIVASLALALPIIRNIQSLNDRSAAPYIFPTPERMLIRLNEFIGRSDPVTVLADPDLSVTIPAYVAHANVVAHRAPTTSEIFPANRQDEALQRLIDQDTFFRTHALTTEAINILRRYDVGYVITSSGSDLDVQLRLASSWFEWLMDDQSYTLYAVHQLSNLGLHTAAIKGNDALAQQQWATAEEHYQAALAEDPGDLLALVGLAESAYAQGNFDDALAKLKQAASQSTQAQQPVLHYRLGELYAEQGQAELALAEFRQAQQQAPYVSRFHVALGHACLAAGNEQCAAEQYVAAVADEDLPDDASRLVAQADLWRQVGRFDKALPLYGQAVALRPSQYNRLVLERAYREVGQFEPAQRLIRSIRAEHPLSAEMATASAVAMAAQNQYDEAVSLYQRAIWVQMLQAQETAATRLALARLLLEINRLDEADEVIERVLTLQPYSAAAFRLKGDLYSRRQHFDQAMAAYQRAFELDPSQVVFYALGSDQLGQYDDEPDDALALLQAAVHISADEAALYLALGDQWQNLGDSHAAIEAYQMALNHLDPYLVPTRLRPLASRQSRAFASARLARLYENLGQMEAAMNYYRATVAAAPDDPWVQVTLGDALRRRNDLAAAEAAYRQAIQHDPGYVNAYVRLAELLAAQGDSVQADTLYAEALQIAVAQSEQNEVQQPETDNLFLSLPLFSDETLVGPAQPTDGAAASVFEQLRQTGENVNTVRGLARLYQMQGQTRQAIDLYQQRLEQGEAVGWSPVVLAQYYKSLGDLFLTQNRLDRATAMYRRAVALTGGWIEARLGLAETLASEGDSAEALEQLQAAVATAPGSVEAQIALANLLDQQGKQDQALSIYQATAQAYPGHPRATLALARALQDRNQWQQAVEVYQQTITLNPGTADAYAGLAELYINQGRYDEAEALLQQALAVDRQNANTYIRLGDLAQSRGDAGQSLVWYQQAAALPLIGQSSYVTLVDSLIRHGDYVTALATIETVLGYQPGDGELWLRLGQVRRALGQYAEAKEALLEAKRLASDSRPDVALAELYLAQGKPQAALATYQQAIDLQPAEALHYLATSQVLVTQADFEQALAVLQAGQVQASQPAALYATMAALYLQEAKPELALQTLERGLSNDGDNPQLRLALGNYYAARADFDQAEQQYSLVLAQQPDSAAVHAALGDLYLRRGDSATALDYYQQAVSLEPANPGYYLALGNSYQLGQRPDEAANAYFQALTFVPTLANAYATLAAYYQGQERWDEAQALYERGLTMAPTSEILLAGYSAFLLGRGQAEQALALLDEAVQRSPTAAALTARASLYRTLGRNQEAEHDLQAAREQAPGSVTVLVALGDFYRAQGDTARARQLYEEATVLMPGVPTGYLRLGDLANEQGNQEEAQQYADAARAAEPGALVRPDSTP